MQDCYNLMQGWNNFELYVGTNNYRPDSFAFKNRMTLLRIMRLLYLLCMSSTCLYLP